MDSYFTGSEWAQRYAKEALPVLISFAESRRPTTYTELAKILLRSEKYRHPLMSALGRLGEALEALTEALPKKFGKIPPIQLLVCNRRTGRPGNLALNFLGFNKSQTDKMSKLQLDTIVSAAHQKIFEYPRWHHVLKAFGLKPITLKLPAPDSVLPKIKQLEQHPGGEDRVDEAREPWPHAEFPKVVTMRAPTADGAGLRLRYAFSQVNWHTSVYPSRNSSEHPVR